MNTNAVTIATTAIKRYIQSKIDRDTFNITIKSRQVMVHVTLIHKYIVNKWRRPNTLARLGVHNASSYSLKHVYTYECIIKTFEKRSCDIWRVYRLYKCCHIAIDFRWLFSMSFQCFPSASGRFGPMMHRPTNSPWPIRSWSSTVTSRLHFGRRSEEMLKVRASFQTGEVVLLFTDVFFLFTFFPSTTREILTYGSENEVMDISATSDVISCFTNMYTCYVICF